MYTLLRFRYQRFHVSWLMGWLACGILVGIVFGAVWPVPGAWMWGVAGLALLPAIFQKRRWWSVLMIIVVGMLIGWQRGSGEAIALSGYQHLFGQNAGVSGIITDDPQVSNGSQRMFSLGKIVISGERMQGRMFISTPGAKTLKRGDRVILSGKIVEGFGSYQASMRYAEVVAVNSGATPIRDLRDAFSDGVRRVVAEPQSSLGLGFVVGQRSALPPELDEQLKAVGLTHIVVASGYNLTILVRFARRVLAKYSRYAAMAVSSGLVMGFIAFSGLTPSMTRAGAVTLLSLLAWYYGRRFHPLLLIVFVAAGTAYADPIYLWSDIGWYLSFLAFIGVLIVSPLAIARFFRGKKPGSIAHLVIETMAASLMTLPLILVTFGQLPVFAILANVLVAPLIPFAMLATTLAGVTGILAWSALGWLGLPAQIVIGYIVAVVEFFSAIDWAQTAVAIPPTAMILSYLAIGTLLLVWWRTGRHSLLDRSIVE